MKRQFVDIDRIEGRFENRIPEHRKQSVFPLLAQLKREYIRMSFVIHKLIDAERTLRAVLIMLNKKRAQVKKTLRSRSTEETRHNEWSRTGQSAPYFTQIFR